MAAAAAACFVWQVGGCVVNAHPGLLELSVRISFDGGRRNCWINWQGGPVADMRWGPLLAPAGASPSLFLSKHLEAAFKTQLNHNSTRTVEHIPPPWPGSLLVKHILPQRAPGRLAQLSLRRGPIVKAESPLEENMKLIPHSCLFKGLKVP